MKVNFLLAEEVRPEANNKISILGFFAGDIVIMHKGDLPQGLPEGIPAGLERLAILATIVDAPDGVHQLKARLLEPSGELYPSESLLGEAIAQKGFSHVAVFQLKPFIVKQPGMFTFEFFVDDQVFKFPFEIREQNLMIKK